MTNDLEAARRAVEEAQKLLATTQAARAETKQGADNAQAIIQIEEQENPIVRGFLHGLNDEIMNNQAPPKSKAPAK